MKEALSFSILNNFLQNFSCVMNIVIHKKHADLFNHKRQVEISLLQFLAQLRKVIPWIFIYEKQVNTKEERKIESTNTLFPLK